jgi:hypothetical protein
MPNESPLFSAGPLAAWAVTHPIILSDGRRVLPTDLIIPGDGSVDLVVPLTIAQVAELGALHAEALVLVSRGASSPSHARGLPIAPRAPSSPPAPSGASIAPQVPRTRERRAAPRALELHRERKEA